MKIYTTRNFLMDIIEEKNRKEKIILTEDNFDIVKDKIDTYKPVLGRSTRLLQKIKEDVLLDFKKKYEYNIRKYKDDNAIINSKLAIEHTKNNIFYVDIDDELMITSEYNIIQDSALFALIFFRTVAKAYNLKLKKMYQNNDSYSDKQLELIHEWEYNVNLCIHKFNDIMTEYFPLGLKYIKEAMVEHMHVFLDYIVNKYIDFI
jgi:hypothetical protein